MEKALKTLLQERFHLRKDQWTLKSFQKKWVDELHVLFLDSPFSPETQAAYNYLHNSWNIAAWFCRQAHTTRYFFHHWYVLHNVCKPKVGQEFECHELLKTCRSPYDCPTLTDAGAEALNRLEYLARDVLEIIMSKKPPPPATKGGGITGRMIQNRKKSPAGKSSPAAASTPAATSAPPSPSIESLKSKPVMFPGVLKSGNQNMHQRLHVDFGGVLGSNCFEKVCTQHNYADIGIQNG